MKKIILFVLIIIMGVALVGYQDTYEIYTSIFRQAPVETLTTEQLRETIINGTQWFKNAQENSGHFKYEYAPFLDRYIDDDNMVRQAGGLYVLGELYRKDPKNKLELQEIVEKAISYFEENTVEGELNDKEFKCLLKYSTRCSLGGTSLALIGIIDLVHKTPSLESEYQNLIEDYKNYILAMKLSGKGFRERYYLDRNQSTYESPFSNGEAFLALARYYKYNPDEEVKEVIDEAYDYFEEIYTEEWDNNFYLWGMAALKDLYESDPKEEYFLFVKDFTDWRVESYTANRESSRNRCAYIEGVVSAYSVLEKNISGEEQQHYLEEINFWLAKSKQLQIKSSDFLRLAFNNNFLRKIRLENKEKAIGGFLTASTEPVQRIDFTQHCLNSYLQKLVDIDGEEL